MENSIQLQLNRMDSKLDAILEAQTLTKKIAISPVYGLLDAEEAAAYCRCAKSTIYSANSRGELRPQKHGGRLYYTEKELDRWLAVRDGRAEIEAEAEQRLADR